MVVSPVRTDERLSLRGHNLCEVIKSIGTESYGQTCLAFLAKSLSAEHWALFRFRSGSPRENAWRPEANAPPSRRAGKH